MGASTIESLGQRAPKRANEPMWWESTAPGERVGQHESTEDPERAAMEELALLEIEDDAEDFEEFWLWRRKRARIARGHRTSRASTQERRAPFV